MVGEIHLFPDLGNGIGIDPLVRARVPNVVKVVVNARPAAAPAFFVGRETADVSPVVVRPEQGDVVWHAHALFVVFLHFFVERPDLGNLVEVRVHFTGQNFALVGDDLFEKPNVALRRHGQVAVAAHRESDNALVVLVALDALGPEFAQLRSVGRIVPGALSVPLPFLLRTQHGLVMRRAHHDSIFIGKFRIEGIVFVESAVPHGRP